jgi:hypothetical protein
MTGELESERTVWNLSLQGCGARFAKVVLALAETFFLADGIGNLPVFKQDDLRTASALSALNRPILA